MFATRTTTMLAVTLFLSVVAAMPHIDTESEFDSLLQKFSSLPFAARRQSVLAHKSVWRTLGTMRDELRFAVDWQYIATSASRFGSCAANVTELAEARLDTLNRLVDEAKTRLDVLESRLKDAKRSSLPARPQLDQRMRAELRYMLDYADRVRSVPGYTPKFNYQRRLLDPHLRREIVEILDAL
jgi:hypothetical protein